MNNKAHLRPKDFDSSGDIIPMSWKEEKGDLISREALRNIILNDRKLDGANANWEVNRILVHIDNAPAVDIKDEIAGAYNEGYMCGNKEAEKERPQGEWIDTGSGQECNICHEIQYGYDNFRHFCANCGAKMTR